MEKSFDSRILLSGLYDFAGSGQPCGNSYISSSKTCRVGQGEARTARLTQRAAGVAEGLTKLNLEQLAITNKEQANEDSERFQQELDKQVTRLKEGKVTKKEMDELLVKHLDGDVQKAEFVFIGMENAIGPEAYNGKNGSESAGQWTVANMLAVKALTDEGMTLSEATRAGTIEDIAVLNQQGGTSKDVLGKNQYIANSVYLAAQATGTPLATAGVTSDEALSYYFGTKMTTIEMGAVSASTVGDGSLNKAGNPTVNNKGQNSADPNRSGYGALISGQAGPRFTGYSREYVRKELSDDRAKFIGQELQKAASNPQFQGGFGAPGSGGKYTQFQKQVIDPLAQQGLPTWTTTVPLTTGTKKADGTSKRGFVKDGKQTINHTMHVVELAPGKYFVSGDLSMNTSGYSAGNNHFKAYQQAITNVQNGSATKYSPTKSKASGGSSVTKASTARKSSQATRQSTKRVESKTKKEAQVRVKRLEKDIKATKQERTNSRPGTTRYNNAVEKLKSLDSQLKTAQEEAK